MTPSLQKTLLILGKTRFPFTESRLLSREAVEVIEATKLCGEIETLLGDSAHSQLGVSESTLNPTFQSI